MTYIGRRLAEEQQITTPRDWRPAQHVTGRRMLKVAAVTIALIGFAIGFGWGWLTPIGR
jgi:hypothetical protein